MNIAVVDASLFSYHFRPDITLNKNLEDFYLPEGVEQLEVMPCIYSRLGKSGKAVSGKFADRYFDNIDFGCLLTDATSDAPWGEATSLDLTSIFPLKFLHPDTFSKLSVALSIGDRDVYNAAGISPLAIAEGIIKVSRKAYLRQGDIIAVQLLPTGFPLKQGDIIGLRCGESEPLRLCIR
ncbi:MAG: hypothetical protein HUJ91_04800 [Bacteroidales bacterium]|nr:hypothetical protein [Bacteroidales bacterium]